MLRIRSLRVACFLGIALVFASAALLAEPIRLENSVTLAEFGPEGLLSVRNIAAGTSIALENDGWSLTINDTTLKSSGAQPKIEQTSKNEVAYRYDFSGYQIEVVYQLKPGWKFVSKQIRVLHAPDADFTVRSVVPWQITVKNPIAADFVPSTYVPQFGSTIEQSRKRLPGKDFGEFLRFDSSHGAMLTVQNPFLDVERSGQELTIAYAPQMEWKQAWGAFESDAACIGAYALSGHRLPREMVKEWHLPPAQQEADGADRAEVEAFADCVRAFLINPAPAPISVEVGWTLNDYQIDTGTAEGRAEYKRILDMTSELGIQTLLYAPANSQLSKHSQSADTWGWEYVLWLGLGEKIRKGEWDPAKDAIPPSVAEMLHYAKQRHVGLLAYVYPSVPFAKNSSWLVQRGHDRETVPETGSAPEYATLASRALQDYLIENLIAFKRRTGIAGYSFDYTWLNLPGSSSYAQWYGWRRVLETLRKTFPSIVIDGRQSYQMYGPWTWLAGSYPHPTGNDEQPESFRPYPDLHFDRVSADRMRFVNYWYRNYQFAPEEVIPGYATHQTERSRNIPNADGRGFTTKMMYTRYKPRDWDYLGFRYSFLSSIATAGWNNVVNMIPARDMAEAHSFSAEDKAWIRDWLQWTVAHKEYLRHTRTILDQPAMGHVDGTAAISDNKGYLFLFNPNYKRMPAEISLDSTIGLTGGSQFLLREVYPQKGRLIGKPGAGLWNMGDKVHLQLDGTSATVLELLPAEKTIAPLIFNSAHQAAAVLKNSTLALAHVAGEPGAHQQIGVLLPSDAKLSAVSVNGRARKYVQQGRYVEIPAHFAGIRFSQAEQVPLTPGPDGSLQGTFVVPTRILDQLAARKRAWPIPWTKEDYESTWLVPERLLLFVQMAGGTDATTVTASLDGQSLAIHPAYSSGRVNPPCFVGFYADLSRIEVDKPHTIQLRIPQDHAGQLQGVFFDNVLPQFTESLAP